MTQQVLQPSEEKTLNQLQIRIESEDPATVIQLTGKLTPALMYSQTHASALEAGTATRATRGRYVSAVGQ